MAEEDINKQVEERVTKALEEIKEQSEKQLASTLDQVRSERVIKAEKIVESLRTWLPLYFGIVTLLFFGIGFVAVRNTQELGHSLVEMRQNVDAVSQKKREVDDEVLKAEQELRALREHAQTLEGDLSNFEARYATIRLKAAAASTAPAFLQTPTSINGWMTFQGRNFGKTAGELLAYVQVGTYISPEIKVEQSSIKRWSDTNLSVSLSQNDLASLSNARNLLVSKLTLPPTGVVVLGERFSATDILNPPLGVAGTGTMTVNTNLPPAAYVYFQVVTADRQATQEWSSAISLP